MNVPSDLKYTREHEWVRFEGSTATVGITDYAQGELGDIVFVELPVVGDSVKKESTFGTIEAVKAVSDMYSPVSGKVTEVNGALGDDPTVINGDPYGQGWIVKIEVTDPADTGHLLDAAAYKELINA
jgi:glycine cleavage system H protein